MKLYKELAEYYYEIEKVGRKFEDEIQFIGNIFQKYNIKTVVDLGCGTGEHVYALHQKGFTITGIDISNTMIEVARKRYPQCEFQLGELQNYKKEELVDGVICIFGTFNYIIKNEDIINSLINIKESIHSKGLFVLEIWNSYPVQKIKKKPIAPVSLSKVGNMMIKRNRGFRVATDSDGNSNLVEVNFIFNLNQETVKDRHLMRVFSYEEIEELLYTSGLSIVNTYSSYRMERFQDNAGRMILICKRR